MIDRFEAAVLAALAALSVAVLAGLVVHVWTHGGVVSGADGIYVVDQGQYLNWLRQAGDHLLVGNLYDTGAVGGHRSFLHPGIVLSGLVHRLGAGVALSYLLWKPVAVAALFAGALLYVRRFLGRTWDRRFALVVALFGTSPLAAAITLTHTGSWLNYEFIEREVWPGNYLWGYLFTAIAVGLLPLALLAYERGRLGWTAAAGLVAAWFQPWQGATLVLLLIAGELISDRRVRPRRLALPIAATVMPLVYYFVLSRTDPAWKLADRVNDIGHWPLWVTFAGLAPLAVPAALAYVRPGRLDFGRAALLAWPPAALAIYYLPVGTFPPHALQGLFLPLAVLAVAGVRRRLGDRPVPAFAAVAAAALLVVPGVVDLAKDERDSIRAGAQAFYLTPSERDALAYLERAPGRGGVLAPVYIGTLVPAYTGRATWAGAGSWTPNLRARTLAADRLFGGQMTAAQARALVLRSRARFLLSDCHARADIAPLVRGFTGPPRRFGCATVYRVST